MNGMDDLLLHFLQDIYYAEKLGLRTMAKMAKAASEPELKTAILAHREQSQVQIERLAEVFGALGKKPRSKTCAAMDGLSEESEEAVEDFERGPVLDAALIACGQAVEHYEIARYGTMLSWAKQLGLAEAAALLRETLDEEKANDALMTELAERLSNPGAAKAEGEKQAEEENESKGVDQVKQPPPAAKKAAKPKAAKKPPARTTPAETLTAKTLTAKILPAKTPPAKKPAKPALKPVARAKK